ncbi:MAG: hypothetical protein WCJ29_04530 [bacterium]
MNAIADNIPFFAIGTIFFTLMSVVVARLTRKSIAREVGLEKDEEDVLIFSVFSWRTQIVYIPTLVFGVLTILAVFFDCLRGNARP